MAALYKKDPDAHKDYAVDWGSQAVRADQRWLPADDTIDESAWTIDGPDDALERTSSTFTEKTSTIWVRGGTPGAAYTATNRITSAQGRVEDTTITFYINER